MVAAPVGFQCRECVAQASRTAPVYTAREVLAGGAAARYVPYVSYAIVGICVAAYLIGFLFPQNQMAVDYGMFPYAIALNGEWYRLVTSAFLHAGILHIAFNMLVLVMLGPTLERILGHVRFAILYLLAAAGGAVASYCFSAPSTLSVGASGAIFGMMGALIVAGRRLKFDITQVLILLVVNLGIGFIGGGTIDWRAHLGGLVTGVLVAFVMAYAPAKNTVLIQTVGCIAILLVLAGITAARTAQLQEQYHAPKLNGSTISAPLR